MKRLDPENSIIIGIGNQGRQDDGIGWACLDHLIENGWSGKSEYRYQLNIEDAELISAYEHILFIDADKRTLPGGFLLERVHAKPLLAHSSHFLPPSNVLYLCQQFFNRFPDAFLLSITGYSWELSEGITSKGTKNYMSAITSIFGLL